MTSPYTKPWLSIADQLRKLKSYGLVVSDDTAVSDFLRRLNYYRFSGYGLVFEQQMPPVYDARAKMGLPDNWKTHPLWICL